MKLMVCVDDNNGMMFNQRRQSQDRLVRARILQRSQGGRLWMNAYSQGQFQEEAPQLQMAADFLEQAEAGDFCFVENSPLLPWEEKIEELILYKWNRAYPADQHFDIPLTEHGWQLRESTEFAGFSHEKITEEVYCR